jgi:hypothetical protein
MYWEEDRMMAGRRPAWIGSVQEEDGNWKSSGFGSFI